MAMPNGFHSMLCPTGPLTLQVPLPRHPLSPFTTAQAGLLPLTHAALRCALLCCAALCCGVGGRGRAPRAPSGAAALAARRALQRVQRGGARAAAACAGGEGLTFPFSFPSFPSFCLFDELGRIASGGKRRVGGAVREMLLFYNVHHAHVVHHQGRSDLI